MQNKNKREIALANKSLLSQIYEDVTSIKADTKIFKEFRKDFEIRMRKVERFVIGASSITAFLIAVSGSVALVLKIMGKI